MTAEQTMRGSLQLIYKTKTKSWVFIHRLNQCSHSLWSAHNASGKTNTKTQPHAAVNEHANEGI